MGINIDYLIDRYTMCREKLAVTLFPSSKHSKSALERLCKKEQAITEKQIIKLRNAIGCSFDELFAGNGWRQIDKKNYIWFIRGECRARLNIETFAVDLFKNFGIVKTIYVKNGISTIELIAILDSVI